MRLRDMPIRRKLMLIVLLTSIVVMVMIRGAFFTYELMTFQEVKIRQLTTLGEILSANSTTALTSRNPEEAKKILSALKAERHIVAAALYDENRQIVARHPDTLTRAELPAAPGPTGYRFDGSEVSGFQPVMQQDRLLGTLYLKFDTGSLQREFVWGSVRIALAVMAVVLLLSYPLSLTLQQQISRPILALAKTAHAITLRHDYSVRAARSGNDEVGELTDAFNQMLAQIERQNQSLRDKETELQTIIESLSEGLAVSNLQGELLHFNRAALDLHGFSSVEECRRHLSAFAELFELSTPEGEVIPLERWPLARILRGERLHDLEVTIRRRGSDASRILNYGGVLVPDQQGNPQMAVVTIRDVTERRRAAAEILQLNWTLEQRVADRTAQLTAANKELESFSYSVSHDLRAPLRHIDGYAQLLQKRIGSTLDETSQRFLTNIIGSAKGLGQLIDELLDFSRTGRSELRHMEVDTQELVAGVRQGLHPEGQDRRIEWRIGELPGIHADPAMLRQVWSNLLSNAVKYTRGRDPATVEVFHRADEVDGHVFGVRDNGAGFDMRYADKLFGVFQRLHSQGEFEGTGIGLANVRRIIQRHGGRTWAEGAVGQGATFYFSLPAAGKFTNSPCPIP